MRLPRQHNRLVVACAAAVSCSSLVTTASAAAEGFAARNNGGAGAGVVSLPVRTHRDAAAAAVRAPSLARRDDDDGDAFEAVLKNRDFYYTIDVEIGTPGQPITVLLDTGSSELWVNPNCTALAGDTQRDQCTASGRYDPDDSTTPPTGPFGTKSFRYGDASKPDTHSSAEFEYYADDVALVVGGGGGGGGSSDSDSNGSEDTNRLRLANQTFGVALESQGQAQGILGLAPDLNAGFDEGPEPHSLLLSSMAAQGLIARRAFALDLRHADSDEGAVVFGGLDRSRFAGALEPVPLVDGIRGEPRLAIRLSSITTTVPAEFASLLGDESDEDTGSDDSSSSSSNGTSTNHHDLETSPSSRNVMLDSGTTVSRLQVDAAMSVLRTLGARSLYAVAPDTADPAMVASGFWLAPCALRRVPVTEGYVGFRMANKTLRVPLSEFVLEYGPGGKAGRPEEQLGRKRAAAGDDDSEDGDENHDDDDDDDDGDDEEDQPALDDLCYVGLVVTSDQQVLGDNFLRAGYFVFDWDAKQVHVAQAASCGGDSDMRAVDADDGVPSTEGLCEMEWDEADDVPISESPSSSSTAASGTPASTPSPSADESAEEADDGGDDSAAGSLLARPVGLAGLSVGVFTGMAAGITSLLLLAV